MDITTLIQSNDQIEQILFTRVKANANTIVAAHQLKGGWEGWAQVSLALEIKNKWPNTTVLREQAVYGEGGGLADIVLTSAADPNFIQIIELKVDLVNKATTSLANRVDDDINKIRQGGAKVKYTRAYFVAVGICVTAASQNHMNNIKPGPGEKYFKWPVGNEIDVFVWHKA
ncbi:hypothetical protein H2198_008170 [Neophaeococcomyces mojaviensis]|uniref:Uncharacterized protein n=1 Tax=Neophaeococcomyces mojaviensis TaxID=3383035 RepID=A0ACC2ZXW9_9EURO|nr:hypothetical protein H2198_008170 [Knufia sp. JES_112]